MAWQRRIKSTAAPKRKGASSPRDSTPIRAQSVLIATPAAYLATGACPLDPQCRGRRPAFDPTALATVILHGGGALANSGKPLRKGAGRARPPSKARYLGFDGPRYSHSTMTCMPSSCLPVIS